MLKTNGHTPMKNFLIRYRRLSRIGETISRSLSLIALQSTGPVSIGMASDSWEPTRWMARQVLLSAQYRPVEKGSTGSRLLSMALLGTTVTIPSSTAMVLQDRSSSTDQRQETTRLTLGYCRSPTGSTCLREFYDLEIRTYN